MIHKLTSYQSAYLADNMARVSRSFAIVAPEVEAPMDDYLATAYLVCRVVDNIEDVARPFAWKQARFQEFEALLHEPERATEVLSRWQQQTWPGLTADEERMMGLAGGLLLWEIYAELPAAYRRPITIWAQEMAQGMCRTIDPAPNDFFTDYDGVRLPLTHGDYDRYCYYVAGTVGSMITDMVVHFYGINGETADALRHDSRTCGRGLQKTNIVKDFGRDLARGFSFLPQEWLAEIDYAPLRLGGAPVEWKRKVLQDVLAELDGSVSYVTGLPLRAPGFRKAGLLMLLPAYETLLLAANRLANLFTTNHAVKISRPKMLQIIALTQKIAADDEAIATTAGELSRRISAELGAHG